MTEHLPRIGEASRSQTIVKVAVTRTIACNLLYRYLVATRLDTNWSNCLSRDPLHFSEEPPELSDFVA